MNSQGGWVRWQLSRLSEHSLSLARGCEETSSTPPKRRSCIPHRLPSPFIPLSEQRPELLPPGKCHTLDGFWGDSEFQELPWLSLPMARLPTDKLDHGSKLLRISALCLAFVSSLLSFTA